MTNTKDDIATLILIIMLLLYGKTAQNVISWD
jgi:hypothetical protein